MVVAAQCVVLVAGDSRIFSGSDAGGRAAAVLAASENGGCDHDLGYWAQEWDPTGRVHPIVNTVAVDDRYVQPATLPYICTTAPLARAAGLPVALAVSMAGVLLAAVGAWIIERSAGGSGLLGFALVGGVGSVAFYGTDTWEHAPATGAAVFGTALILCRDTRWTGLLGGLIWGLALTMRVETAAVAVGIALAATIVGEVRRSLLADRIRVLLAAAGAAFVVLIDRRLQASIIGTDVRTDRASGQVQGAFADLGERLRDALVTTIGLFPTEDDRVQLAIGGAFVLMLVVVGISLHTDAIRPSLVRAFAVVVTATAILRATDPSFVPGLFPSAPIAAAGLLAIRRSVHPRTRVLALGAVIALPAIWAVQWTGNMVPQWGGRYTLLSGALLTVAGAVVVGPRIHTFAARTLIVVSVVIGMLGLVWHVERTNRFGVVLDSVLALPCDEVLVSATPFLLREAGSYDAVRTGVRPDGCRLLSASPSELDFALDVAGRAGADTPTVLVSGVGDDLPEELEGRIVLSRDELVFERIPLTSYVVDLTED